MEIYLFKIYNHYFILINDFLLSMTQLVEAFIFRFKSLLNKKDSKLMLT